MILLDYNLEEISAFLQERNIPKYRAKQILEGLYNGKELNQMSNLPKSMVEEFTKEEIFGLPSTIVEKLTSTDGTNKYLFRMRDGNIVEGVLMRYKYGNTLCISTQAGCKMGCAFCASGLSGLIRNLTAGEILSEVILVNAEEKVTTERAITNIVLMGCGEPLDNYENVIKFLRIVTSPDCLNISPRNISLSTCGLVPKIDKLIEEKLPITLTISLHAPRNELRDQIMPVNKSYKIEELVAVSKRYFEATGRRVVFEYALIKSFNDSDREINEMASLLKGFPIHINLIPLNYVKERGLKGVTRQEALDFCEKLTKAGMSATVRRTMGNDIQGACGQLRRKYIEEND